MNIKYKGFVWSEIVEVIYSKFLSVTFPEGVKLLWNLFVLVERGSRTLNKVWDRL